MNKTIEIIVSPKGDARLETKGFAGQVCREASQFLDAALGEQVSEKLTPAFFSPHACNHINASSGD